MYIPIISSVSSSLVLVFIHSGSIRFKEQLDIQLGHWSQFSRLKIGKSANYST